MRIIIILVFGLFFVVTVQAQVGSSISADGSTPNDNAMLDVQSPVSGAGKGMLIPRVTSDQRTNANVSLAGGLLDNSGNLRGGAAQGLIVYQTDGVQGMYFNTSQTATPSWALLGADDSSVSVGREANGAGAGAAVGYDANGNNYGAAMGYQAKGSNYGVAAGYQANGSAGVGVGRNANGSSSGMAVGMNANGYYVGTAAGYAAAGTNYGAALGYYANGSGSGAALGVSANGYSDGVAVGRAANGYLAGAALGYSAKGYNAGAAVGYGADGSDIGAAVGEQAKGTNSGAAIGYYANGSDFGVAVGRDANSYYYGAALGRQAKGTNIGVAVGNMANGSGYGAALGREANGYNVGAAVGCYAHGNNNGVAVGYSAEGTNYGVAVGWEADGAQTNMAIGFRANAGSGLNRIAIGNNVTNQSDGTAAIRGHLYLDGGTGMFYRASFGEGSWTAKAFEIDHPLDPENKVLRHFCLEGPQVWNVYAGNAQLVNGRAVVQLPDYYSALNLVGSEIYSLTPVGEALVWVDREVSDNCFAIAGKLDIKVSWTIKVLRNDPGCLEDLRRRPVEQLKSEIR